MNPYNRRLPSIYYPKSILLIYFLRYMPEIDFLLKVSFVVIRAQSYPKLPLHYLSAKNLYN